jgi:hypothetical protein
MLKVVEDMNLSSHSFSRYNVVTLRHVSSLVHFPIMIKFLIDSNLVTLLMTTLGITPLGLCLKMIHRHSDLVNLHLIILTLFLVRAVSPQQKSLI